MAGEAGELGASGEAAKPGKGLRASHAKVGLSTASVYPENTAAAFELAAKLGYDGVEVMVWTDPTSQDPYALLRLSQHYQVPILAIHAPCLIITQRVWTTPMCPYSSALSDSGTSPATDR